MLPRLVPETLFQDEDPPERDQEDREPRMAAKPLHHDRGRAPAQAGQVESRTTS